ncbi:hypothetical protein [Lederbergia citri]|uniref:Uncharacterized protein n=1 Tax=Lederbergia citri TaxID=2833580 RepID=A0A942YHG8_9BACI|nr:hypothetical protein [Lederbergia citri]MBS4195769.1 hypothetical protein [Lederbergia citri]
MTLTEYVNLVLKPFSKNILNESAKDYSNDFFVFTGTSVYSYKTLLFYTTDPHLLLAYEKDEEFKHVIIPYEQLDANRIIKDVCEFAKTLPMEKDDQLDYCFSTCRKILYIIDREFIQIYEDHHFAVKGKKGEIGRIVKSYSSTSPFLILEWEEEIERIFNLV